MESSPNADPREYCCPPASCGGGYNHEDSSSLTMLSSTVSTNTLSTSSGVDSYEHWQRWFRTSVNGNLRSRKSLLLDFVDTNCEQRMMVPPEHERKYRREKVNNSLVQLETARKTREPNRDAPSSTLHMPQGSLKRRKTGEMPAAMVLNRDQKLCTLSPPEWSRGWSLFEEKSKHGSIKKDADDDHDDNDNDCDLNALEQKLIAAAAAARDAWKRPSQFNPSPFACLMSRKRSSACFSVQDCYNDWDRAAEGREDESSESSHHELDDEPTADLIAQQEAIWNQIRQEQETMLEQRQRQRDTERQRWERQRDNERQQCSAEILPTNQHPAIAQDEYSSILKWAEHPTKSPAAGTKVDQKQITLYGCPACGQMMSIDKSIPIIFCPTCGSLSRADWSSQK